MSEAQNGGNVMERLTKRLPSGAADYNYPKSCYIGDGSGADRISQSAFRQRCVERLAEYEETGLEPEMCANYKTFEDEAISKGVPFKRIVALMEADKAGRLVVLPCKVGDTVYRIVRDADPHIARDEVRNIYFADDMTLCVELVGGRIILSEKFGKTVFLTREEAKRALEAMKNGN